MDEQKPQIAPLRPRLRYSPQIRGEVADLIFEFFTVYSRFEFALKQIGYRRIAGDGHIEPAWRWFAATNQDKFNPDKSPELRQACNYFLSFPPKIQVVENDQLSWKRNQRRENESDAAWVIRSIGIVRNNLFHGGKFPWDQVRDVSLLSYGLVILYEYLELDQRLRDIFMFSPETTQAAHGIQNK